MSGRATDEPERAKFDPHRAPLTMDAHGSLSSARARGAETPNSACRVIKTFYFVDDGLDGWRENQLRNLRPTRHRERIAAQIYEDDVKLAAVIGIERARG